jgi:hypothetical protein
MRRLEPCYRGLVSVGFVVVPLGLVVVPPGVAVVPVLPGSVLELSVGLLPEVPLVSVLDPVEDPIEPFAPGVPVDELVPMPVLVSVVPLDGLVLVVSLPVVDDERGLVVEPLLLRGVVGPGRPSGELLVSWPVPAVSEVVPELLCPELAAGVPVVDVLEPLVLSVPAVVPVVPVPVDDALPDVPAPADPPAPLVCPSAATANTIAPAAKNVATFSFIVIGLPLV